MIDTPNWFLEHKRNPSALFRFFCFHHSGGGASAYFPWIEQLSPHIELIAIQLPGRENRFTEPLINNINDITAYLTEGFCYYIDKPFFVFGHSLGALLSFEFIKAIHERYAVFPLHMIVSATKAPHLPFRVKRLSQLDNSSLKEELKIYNGIDERILQNDELLDLFLPIIRSDFSICENYRYAASKPFPFDILALSGTNDPTVTEEELLGWSAYTTEKFEPVFFPGGHFFIKEHQKSILEMFNQIGENHYSLTGKPLV
ncbi:MAG: putative thioesterase [Alphaproteobacteria bacterium]|nr:putative thioesterase [Alphaproteobacteria bacterium]